MDSTRKRKMHFRSTPIQAHFSSLSFAAFRIFFVASFLYLLSTWWLRIFRPVLIVSTLTLHSSAVHSIRQSDDGSEISGIRVQDRVLFPDHVLVMSSFAKEMGSDPFDCVYHEKKLDVLGGRVWSWRLNGSGDAAREKREQRVVFKSALSVDGYDEGTSIVRCPLPPPTYSAAVDLRRRGDGQREESKVPLENSAAVNSWEAVAYAAWLDGDTVVVFAKGLNLRQGREQDPARFVCLIWSGGGGFVLSEQAVTAAQEVVRCVLPASIRSDPMKARGLKFSIAAAHSHGKILARQSLRLPSVARISGAETLEERNQEKYELCVCTMVWNQAPALREWIVYHAWLGVQRWFVYDNNSDDGTKEVIDELEKENHNVSRHPWPWIKTQEAGFSHCALRAKGACRWVGFIDVDEFFYFPIPPSRSGVDYPPRGALKSVVANLSASASAVGEFRTACRSFGPSGLRSPPPQGVTAGYTCRLQNPERHKSIVRPDALDGTLLNVVHHFRLRRGFRYLNLPQSWAVVNHYKYQVWESFRAKFFRRVATYVADWRENQNEGSRDRVPGLGTEAIEPANWRLQFCEVWDTGLRDFVSANLADPATGLLPWQNPSSLV